jgi:hypothetical protein
MLRYARLLQRYLLGGRSFDLETNKTDVVFNDIWRSTDGQRWTITTEDGAPESFPAVGRFVPRDAHSTATARMEIVFSWVTHPHTDGHAHTDTHTHTHQALWRTKELMSSSLVHLNLSALLLPPLPGLFLPQQLLLQQQRATQSHS